jgi:predicted nucleic acid-binding Zn ribbon protein
MFEEMRNINDYLNTKCPKCSSKNISVVMCPVAFILKGGGWAKDGYSNPTQSKEKK